jgi:tetratricopeptide (TPR) repeat protein
LVWQPLGASVTTGRQRLRYRELVATIRVVSFREKRRRVASPWLVARAAACLTLAQLMVAGSLGGAALADDTSDARRYAQRATALAASGKCRQAVIAFDKALAILRDPALLFNRGECHRKLGDDAAAIDDYKQFLADLPRAPNRADVEKRIAELQRKSAATAAAGPRTRDVGGDPPARVTTAPPPGQGAGASPPPAQPSGSDGAAGVARGHPDSARAPSQRTE